MTTAETTGPALVDDLGELHFHRLLVAVDGSDNAMLALAAAVTAARRDNAAITLIAVAPDMVAESTRWLSPGAPSPTQLQAEADADLDRRLRQAIERIPADIPVTTVLRHGRPGPQIVAFAAESNFDAILVGARGLGRVRALVGSVSLYVLHHADVPVFVAHAPGGGSRTSD